jgi:hypothetical protein
MPTVRPTSTIAGTNLWAVPGTSIAPSFHLSHVRTSYGDMEPQLFFRIWEHAMYECFLRDTREYLADMIFIRTSFYQLKEINRITFPMSVDWNVIAIQPLASILSSLSSLLLFSSSPFSSSLSSLLFLLSFFFPVVRVIPHYLCIFSFYVSSSSSSFL